MKYKLIIVCLAILMAGCRATDSRPIVDMQGVNVAQYNSDLAQCQTYADQVETEREVARSTVGGAVVGGAVGAIVGNGNVAQRTAGAGAVVGAARGAGSAVYERDRVIRNCLRGRGYRVLN